MLGAEYGGAGEGGAAAAAAVPVPRPVARGLADGRQVGNYNYSSTHASVYCVLNK